MSRPNLNDLARYRLTSFCYKGAKPFDVDRMTIGQIPEDDLNHVRAHSLYVLLGNARGGCSHREKGIGGDAVGHVTPKFWVS